MSSAAPNAIERPIERQQCETSKSRIRMSLEPIRETRGPLERGSDSMQELLLLGLRAFEAIYWVVVDRHETSDRPAEEDHSTERSRSGERR